MTTTHYNQLTKLLVKLRKSPTWSLKVMIKALSQPISSFLNTDEDNERLENAKKLIKESKTQ